MNQTETLDYPDDEGRWVELRKQFLAANHDLRDPEAESVAWAELGYSESGIASMMDSTKSTVSGYLEKAEHQWGMVVTFARTDDFDSELSLDDRSKYIEGQQCPGCGAKMLATKDRLEALPSKLKGIPNDNGELYPVRIDGQVFLREASEKIEPWSDERVSIPEWFQSSRYDVICSWCLWSGEWGDL